MSLDSTKDRVDLYVKQRLTHSRSMVGMEFVSGGRLDRGLFRTLTPAATVGHIAGYDELGAEDLGIPRLTSFQRSAPLYSTLAYNAMHTQNVLAAHNPILYAHHTSRSRIRVSSGISQAPDYLAKTKAPQLTHFVCEYLGQSFSSCVNRPTASVTAKARGSNGTIDGTRGLISVNGLQATLKVILYV